MSAEDRIEERAKRLEFEMFHRLNPPKGVRVLTETQKTAATTSGPHGRERPANIVSKPRKPKGRPLTQPSTWYVHAATAVHHCGGCGTLIHPGQRLYSRIHPQKPRETQRRCLICGGANTTTP